MSAKLTLINGDGASSRRDSMERLASALDTDKSQISEKIRHCCNGSVIGISNVFRTMTSQEKAEELQEQLGHHWFDLSEEPEYSFKTITDPEEAKRNWPALDIRYGQVFAGPDINPGNNP